MSNSTAAGDANSDEIELHTLPKHHAINIRDNESDLSYSDEDEDLEDAQLLGSPSDLQTRRQMKRRNREPTKKRSTPSLLIYTGQNGHAAGDMNSHLEMRKKDSSIDSPSSAQHAARVMDRSDFTLDENPPATPLTPKMINTSFFALPERDRRNFLLLVLLYFLQGIPMGLAMGSVPFLLKPHLSYGQIGVFSLASYPYSLKLLWSPIVDAVWSTRLGRRKSWITPIQTISGMAMVYLGGRVAPMMKAAGENGDAGVWGFTQWWFLLVFFCATQDIAVDGWALTLLSPQNISYASTAQTVGLTAGHFLSYTVFLAFNSADFANRWFRTTPKDTGLLSLGTYLAFAGWAYIVVTVGLIFLKKEDRTKDRDGIMDVYRSMWSVLKLKNIQMIIIVHLIAKIGFQANDAVTSLKLLDKGFGQDNMALVVLIDFPFEIALGYYAGQWSTQYTPMRLWSWAFTGRLIAALFAQATVMMYPAGPDVPSWYLLVVIGEHVLSTFMNTVMFVAVSAFHARIADPAIGGTYMTLLATYVFQTFGGLEYILTCAQGIQPGRHVPEILHSQTRRSVHLGDMRSAHDLAGTRLLEGRSRDVCVFLRSRGGETPMYRRRWSVRGRAGWLLHDQRYLCAHRRRNILLLHQAGSIEAAGPPIAGLAGGSWVCKSGLDLSL